jgi:hypothetical protein
MSAKSEMADAFLREIEAHGEKLELERISRAIILKNSKSKRRVSLWRLDVMIFQFLAAHAALTTVTASDVLNEILSRLA